MKPYFYLLLTLTFLFSCKNYTRLGSVRNNVCQTLEKKTILFVVFVDSDDTHPWTEYDITSTLDSIQVSINWLEKQAKMNGKTLNIQLEHGINARRDSAIPFKEAFRFKTLSRTLFKYTDLSRGIDLVDKWSDNVSKDVARDLPNDDSKITLTKNRSNNRERLIAKLRNIYKADNIALIFFINNYFENEISIALHTSSGSETEYAVVSEKSPTVIAHEFLHLFGAWDLYISPFDRKLFTKMRKRKAMKTYPNEIMAFTHRDIDSLSLSPLTKYLIGWYNELDEDEGRFFIKRRWKLLKY